MRHFPSYLSIVSIGFWKSYRMPQWLEVAARIAESGFSILRCLNRVPQRLQTLSSTPSELVSLQLMVFRSSLPMYPLIKILSPEAQLVLVCCLRELSCLVQYARSKTLQFSLKNLLLLFVLKVIITMLSTRRSFAGESKERHLSGVLLLNILFQIALGILFAMPDCSLGFFLSLIAINFLIGQSAFHGPAFQPSPSSTSWLRWAVSAFRLLCIDDWCPNSRQFTDNEMCCYSFGLVLASFHFLSCL